MKKLLLIIAMLSLVLIPAYAVTGTINLLYSNGQIVEDNGSTYYEFDVQAYLSEGTEILGAGMAYVEYPTSVFGDLAITNGKVTATKTGILAGTIPVVELYLYDIIENDTYTDVFAITFETPFTGNTELEEYFTEISTDPLAPSDLLNIRMEVVNYGAGYVTFPAYIPGIDNLYYNFHNEVFAGVNITAATEEVNYVDPDPDPVGSVTWKSITADWKKNVIEVKWSTKDEVDIEGYVVKRSANGGEPVEVASYLTDPNLIAQGLVVSRYEINDADVSAGNTYSYCIEAIDIIGAVISSTPVDVVNEAIVEESYPNPFNPSFVVPFELHMTQNVNVKLYDMTGRVVRNIASGNHASGRYEYHVNCDDLSSGVYLLRTIIDDVAHTQKMLLVK